MLEISEINFGTPGTYRSRHYNSREAFTFFAPSMNNRRLEARIDKPSGLFLQLIRSNLELV